MHPIDNSTDPQIDRWMRSLEPRVELALRYCMRDQFQKAKASPTFNRRIDELFNLLKPDEAELAAITRHAREIGQAIDGQIDVQKIDARIKAAEPVTPRRRLDQDLERLEERLKKIAMQKHEKPKR
jgi:hypothetical protein